MVEVLAKKGVGWEVCCNVSEEDEQLDDEGFGSCFSWGCLAPRLEQGFEAVSVPRQVTFEPSIDLVVQLRSEMIFWLMRFWRKSLSKGCYQRNGLIFVVGVYLRRLIQLGSLMSLKRGWLLVLLVRENCPGVALYAAFGILLRG